MQENPFEDGSSRHSRFLSGIVQVNTINQDYSREISGSDQQKLAYATLIVGKEAIAYNDKSKATDYFLEKLLSYIFQVQLKTHRSQLKGQVVLPPISKLSPKGKATSRPVVVGPHGEHLSRKAFVEKFYPSPEERQKKFGRSSRTCAHIEVDKVLAEHPDWHFEY